MPTGGRGGRGTAATVLAVSVVAIALLGAPYFHVQGTLEADVEVTDTGDPWQIQRVSEVDVRLTNGMDRAIRPRFSLMHGRVQRWIYWDVVEGPEELPPGEAGRYVIRPPTTAAAIPYRTRAMVRVGSLGSEREANAGPVRASRRPLVGIRNPAFDRWRTNVVSGDSHPYRWRRTVSARGEETTTIEADERGLLLSAGDIERSQGPWTMAGVTQRVPYPETLTITATPNTVATDVSKTPSHGVGVELIDRDHRIFVLFADVEERRVLYRNGSIEYVFVYVPATAGARRTTTVDVRELYDERGWTRPGPDEVVVDGLRYPGRFVRVHPFAAVYPGFEGGPQRITVHSIVTGNGTVDTSTASMRAGSGLR